VAAEEEQGEQEVDDNDIEIEDLKMMRPFWIGRVCTILILLRCI